MYSLINVYNVYFLSEKASTTVVFIVEVVANRL